MVVNPARRGLCELLDACIGGAGGEVPVVASAKLAAWWRGFDSTLLLQAENRKIEIFSGLNHAFQIKSGDVSTIVWTILRLSN